MAYARNMHVRSIRIYENVSWVISISLSLSLSLFELYPSTTRLHTLLHEARSPDEFDFDTPMTRRQATEGGTGHSTYCREKNKTKRYDYWMKLVEWTVDSR